MSSTPLFRTLTADDMQAVDQVIRTRLHSDVVLIRQVAEYIISAGGKRLRPVLTLMAGRAITVPSLYIAGAADWGIHQRPGAFAAMQAGAAAVVSAGFSPQASRAALQPRIRRRFLAFMGCP